MGITERKEREKLEMRERILAAAMRLFVELGVEKTSIRKIADAIEYSPGTIYLYFKDKDQIFNALHTEAFSMFGKEFQKAGYIKDPYERLHYIGRGYIDFALDHPELYSLMFIMHEPMKAIENQETWDEGKGAFQVLEKTVKECLEKDRIRGNDYRHLSYNLWGHVHGLVSLHIRNRLEMYEGDPRKMIESSYEEMMEILRK